MARTIPNVPPPPGRVPWALLPPAAVLALWVLAAGSAPLAAQSSDEVSVHDGVYSAEQARAGSRVFEAQCSLCHAPAEFAGRIFQITWRGRSVGALYGQVSTTMPLDRPGSLAPDEYAAVIAYILSLNEYPAGEQALAPDPERLERIRIEPVPGAMRR